MIEKLFYDVYSNEIAWCQVCDVTDEWLELTHYIKDQDRITVSTKHSYLVSKNFNIVTACRNGEAVFTWDDFLSARDDSKNFTPLLIDDDLVINDSNQKFYFLEQVDKNNDNTFTYKTNNQGAISSIFSFNEYTTQINTKYLKNFYGKNYDLGQSIYIDRKISKKYNDLVKLKNTDMASQFYRGDNYMVRLSIIENILTEGETLCRIEATKIIRL